MALATVPSTPWPPAACSTCPQALLHCCLPRGLLLDSQMPCVQRTAGTSSWDCRMLICKQPFCPSASHLCHPLVSLLCPAESHPELPFGGSALILSLPLPSPSWKSSRAWRRPSAWPQQSSTTSQCQLTQPCLRRGAEASGAAGAGGVAAPACCVQGWWVLQSGHGAGTVSEPVPLCALCQPGH